MKSFYSRGNSVKSHENYCLRSVQRFAVKVSIQGVTIQHAGREGEEYPTNRASCLQGVPKKPQTIENNLLLEFQ